MRKSEANSLRPEGSLLDFDLVENHRQHVTPLRRIWRIVAGCRCIQTQMGMVTHVIIWRMPAPSMVELALTMFFVVVYRKIPVLEPRDLKTSTLHALGAEPGIVVIDDTIGCKF